MASRSCRDGTRGFPTHADRPFQVLVTLCSGELPPLAGVAVFSRVQ